MESNVEQTDIGVPQGSMLRHMLFLLYMNDLCRLYFPNCKFMAYAEDTYGKNSYEAKCYAGNCLRVVTDWLAVNLLTLNIYNTQFFRFSLPNKTHLLQTLTFSRLITATIKIVAACLCPWFPTLNILEF